jgi:hypothetical protein
VSIALDHPDAWLVDCYDNEQSSQEQHTQHHLYGTGNAGGDWVRLADPTQSGAPALLADNGSGHAFLTTESGADDWLVGTFDGGLSWSARFPSGGSFYGWADLPFVDASTGFVVGPTHYALSTFIELRTAAARGQFSRSLRQNESGPSNAPSHSWPQS